MADKEVAAAGNGRQRICGRRVVYASVASAAVGGPLLGMMGCSFIASVTLLVIASPLLIIFSPLLLCVGCVLVAAVAGFAVAATMGIVGLSSIAWIFRSFPTSSCVRGIDADADADAGGVRENMGEKVEEQAGSKDWAEYLQQKAQEKSPENTR